MKTKFFIIVLLIVFSMLAVLALLHPGFFQSDDGEWMIIRFSAFYQALADGQFPVRFLGRLNHEYGYPVANFLYPGFMYLGVPIHFLGFGFVDTIKIIFGVSMIGSAVFCYLWLLRFFDKFSSLVGSLFYLYTPYHLFDLYKRGSVGEVLALAIVPFILWQIERKSLFWSSISIAALILSHNTLAVLFLSLVVVYLIIQKLQFYSSSERSESRSFNVVSSRFRPASPNFARTVIVLMAPILIGLGLSSFFWIPEIFELQYTIFSQTQISNWQDYFSDIQLIGLSTILIFVLALSFLIKNGHFFNTTKYCKNVTIFFFVLGLLSLFLATHISNFVWDILPVAFVQFPFRFLSLTIVSVAFLSAYIVSVMSNKKAKVPIAAALLIVLVVSAKPFISPSEFFDKEEGFYATNMGTTTVQDEYMPKWVKEKPTQRFVEKVEIVEGVGKAMPAGRQVENISYNSKKISFDVLAEEDSTVRINIIYYPGWRVTVNNQSAEIDYSNEKGVMEIEIPKGENFVELKFSETPLRLFTDIISVVALIGLFLYTSISIRSKFK